MPDDNIPVVLAVADSLASSSEPTDVQRQEALQAIESFRAFSSRFLDSAEKIIQEGKALESELLSTATQGARIGTALTKICRALWTLEDEVFAQRSARIAELAAQGREGTKP